MKLLDIAHLIGLLSVSAGVYLVAGIGYALIAGGFLLIGLTYCDVMVSRSR